MLGPRLLSNRNRAPSRVVGLGGPVLQSMSRTQTLVLIQELKNGTVSDSYLRVN